MKADKFIPCQQGVPSVNRISVYFANGSDPCPDHSNRELQKEVEIERSLSATQHLGPLAAVHSSHARPAMLYA
jgi:hypothetical protein